MKGQQKGNIKDQREAIQEKSVPVDQGWSWIILTGCTIIYFLYVGTLRSFGLFFVEYLEVFGASVSVTSLVSGIQTASYSLFSWPILTVGLQFMSVRQSVIIGAFLCSLSYGLNSLATSVGFLVATQSVIFGAGSAFLYSPSLILIGQYFEKRRGLANGIAIAGSSLGGLVFPPLYSYILYNYGLYGAMIVTSGILLNLFVAAGLLRPPSFYRKLGRFQRESNKTLKVILNEKPIKSSTFLNEINERIISSQPMLVPESPTFVRAKIHRKRRFRTHSENQQIKIQSASESILDKLSDSNLIRHLSNGNMTSQAFINTGNNKNETESLYDKSVPTRYSTKLKMVFSIDTSLITHFPYILNILGYCFGSIAGGIGYIFIPSYAVQQGINVQNTALLLSIIGAADFVGRLLSGYLADRKFMRKQYIVAISQCIVAILMHLARFCTDLWIFAIFSGIFGLFAGMIISLNPTIMMDITGIDRYASGIAIYATTAGITGASTTPFLGFLRDYTGTYHMTFHYIGITSFI